MNFYERRSMMITSNQPFGEGGRIFPDQAMTLRRDRPPHSPRRDPRDECRELPQKAGWHASLVFERLQFLRMYSLISDMFCNAHEAIFRPFRSAGSDAVRPESVQKHRLVPSEIPALLLDECANCHGHVE